MKRFTDTAKWTDPWFRRLSGQAKMLWMYAVDHCNPAGVVEIDLAFVSLDTGLKISESHIKELGDRLETNGQKFIIPKFIYFQYNKISRDCRPHIKVFEAIDSDKLVCDGKGYHFPSYTLSDRVSNKVSDTPQEEEEDKDKTKTGDRVIPSKAKGTLEEVMEFCKANGLYPRDAESCFFKWESNGWTNGGQKIKDWKMTIRAWKSSGHLPSIKTPMTSDCWPSEVLPQPSDDFDVMLNWQKTKREREEREAQGWKEPEAVDYVVAGEGELL